MYTLYSMSGSCSSGIHAWLVSLDIPVEIVFHQDVENYLEINPTGQVPALKTPDGIITEGAAICLYLIKKHGIPVAQDQLLFSQQLMFNYATLHPAYSKMFTAHFAMPDSEQKTALMRVLAENVSKLWEIVDSRLQTQAYLAGDKVGILDYLITIYAHWGGVFPYVEIELGSNVSKLVAKVAALPEFIAVAEKENIELSFQKAP